MESTLPPQSMFMSVKTKLDQLMLPSSFPIQMTELLHRLLAKVSTKDKNTCKKDPTYHAPANEALNREIGKVVQDNNKLHQEIMQSKEDAQTHKNRNFKMKANKEKQTNELKKVCQIKQNKIIELTDKLTQVKYKYNQLMDMIHENPVVQHKYLKKLMRHKKMPLSQYGQQQNFKVEEVPHQNNQYIQMKAKIKARDEQIIRLQSLTTSDSINMNALIHKYQQSEANKQIQFLKEQVDKLNQQLIELTQKTRTIRTGSKQALQEEVDKSYQKIRSLSSNNGQLTRKIQQTQCNQRNQNKLNKARIQNQNNQHQRILTDKADAERQVQTLQNYLKKSEQQRTQLKQNIERYKSNQIQKNAQIQKLQKQAQSNFELKHYEIQSIKTKALQESEQIHKQLLLVKDINYALEEQSKLSKEAVKNLQRIVDELMIRRPRQFDIQQLGIVTQNLRRSQNECMKLEGQIKSLNNLLESINREKKLIKEDNNMLKNIKTINNQLEHQINTLKAANDQLSVQNIKVDSEHRQLKQLNQDQSTLIESLKQKIQGLEHILKEQGLEYEERIRAKAITIVGLSEQVEIRGATMDTLQKKVREMENKLMQEDGKYAQMRKHISLLQESKQLDRQDSKKMEVRCLELQKQLQLTQERCKEQIHLAYIAYKEQIAQINHNNAQYIRKCEDLKAVTEDVTRQNQTLQSQNATLLQSNDHLTSSINRMHSRY